jgi:SPP1 family predicted phage head-tail adaptor
MNKTGEYGAGDLRDRVTLQRKTVARTSAGEETVTWTDEATVWGKVEPIRGREYYQAQAVQSEVNMRFVIRFRFLVSTAIYRVKFGVKYYTIDSVIDVDNMHHWLELMCTEVV